MPYEQWTCGIKPLKHAILSFLSIAFMYRGVYSKVTYFLTLSSHDQAHRHHRYRPDGDTLLTQRPTEHRQHAVGTRSGSSPIPRVATRGYPLREHSLLQ